MLQIMYTGFFSILLLSSVALHFTSENPEGDTSLAVTAFSHLAHNL